MPIQVMRITGASLLGMSGLLSGFIQLAQEKQTTTLEFHSLTTFVSILQKKEQWLDIRTQQNHEHLPLCPRLSIGRERSSEY